MRNPEASKSGAPIQERRLRPRRENGPAEVAEALDQHRRACSPTQRTLESLFAPASRASGAPSCVSQGLFLHLHCLQLTLSEMFLENTDLILLSSAFTSCLTSLCPQDQVHTYEDIQDLAQNFCSPPQPTFPLSQNARHRVDPRCPNPAVCGQSVPWQGLPHSHHFLTPHTSFPTLSDKLSWEAFPDFPGKINFTFCYGLQYCFHITSINCCC